MSGSCSSTGTTILLCTYKTLASECQSHKYTDPSCSNTPGQLRLLNEQPWKGQTWFQNQPLQEWYHRKGEVCGRRGNQGGQWKGSSRLSIFTVDEAGHMAPDDQPEAVEALVGSWISDDWHKHWFDGDKHRRATVFD